MPSAPRHTAVTVTPRPLWRIRVGRELPRYLLHALAVAGLLASARYAIAPPRPVVQRISEPSALLPDLGAEGFASLFARRYLTWDSRDLEARSLALAPFAGSWMEADGGLQPPAGGEQKVQWAEVVQARATAPGEHVYTVAAQTDSAGLLYLSVSVVRGTDGKLALAGYPAFLGAPASTQAESPSRLREVEEPALQTVVTRALRNYLARAESELAADLTASAHVSLPGLTLALQSVHSLDWSPDGRSVLAVVQAQDERGTQYTLGYELDVVSDAGRWEISAIQMDPDT
jgi:Conjugative transposon protein TcpC